jgi:hypothetical protein
MRTHCVSTNSFNIKVTGWTATSGRWPRPVLSLAGESGADKEASVMQEGHSACFTDLALTLANMENSLHETKKGLTKVITCLIGEGEATVAIPQ